MKNKITKTAIFGGSFDPPHFGHIDIVKNLEKRFDKVIVVPSFVSPFKRARATLRRAFGFAKRSLLPTRPKSVVTKSLKRALVTASIQPHTMPKSRTARCIG